MRHTRTYRARTAYEAIRWLGDDDDYGVFTSFVKAHEPDTAVMVMANHDLTLSTGCHVSIGEWLIWSIGEEEFDVMDHSLFDSSYVEVSK
jgi:hypothetical protein